MAPLTRRQLVQRVGLGALAAPAFVPLPLRAISARRRQDRSIEELAALVRRTPYGELMPELVRAARAGASYVDLLGGIFLAGVEDIHPRPVGFKLHAVMMVESAFLLAEAAAPEERLLPVLFNAHRFKTAQAEDEEEGGWVLPPAPAVQFDDLAQARAELVRAFEEFDPERGDRAAVGVLRLGGLEALFEDLWPYGARDFRDIGHRIILTAHVFRVLRRLGGRAAEPAVRSLVHGLLCGADGDTTVPYAANVELAAGLGPVRWDGEERPEVSAELLAELREAAPEGAARAVAGRLEAGVAPRSLWDGLRLAASELLLRRPGLLAVHPVTATNAMHAAWRLARRDRARILLLLQAASWLPRYREVLGLAAGDPPAEHRIDVLEAVPVPAEPGGGALEGLFLEAD